ncbi:MAG: Dickkopf N-terminal cysteine-rich domain-containing protein [bacterium]
MKKVALLLLAYLLFFTVSCGDEKKEEPYVPSMTTFFSQYLNTVCDAASKCTSGLVNQNNVRECPDVIMNNPFPFSGFHKNERVIFKHKYEMMLSAESMGWVFVDMEQAEVCFELIASKEPCNPFDVQLLDISECAAVFSGVKFIKQECFQDEECDNGWCDLKGGRCPGNCVEYKLPDQSCNRSLDRCSPGYVCRSSGCSKAVEGKPGDPCADDDDCGNFLFCRKTGGDALGNCFKKKSEGEPCLEEKECVVGLNCIDNLCSGSRVSNHAGAPCGVQEEKDKDGNPIVLSCNEFSKLECSVNKACQKIGSDSNMPCSTKCDKGLYCEPNSKACQWQKTAGLPCTSDENCLSLYCFNTVCAAPQCLTIHNAD